jgi:hypothetical protein
MCDCQGGRMLMEGLRGNSTLTALNLSSNSVGLATAETLSGILMENTVPLAALDLSVNNFDERCAEVRVVVSCGYELCKLLACLIDS